MSFRNLATLLLLVGTVAQFGISGELWGNQNDEPKRADPVRVGEKAPDFTLEDLQGNRVTLSSTRGKTPTVLVFFRGYW
jgi:cytochrome oxidase Cu insertion factor (SCO1/SenC/PrrC family)